MLTNSNVGVEFVVRLLAPPHPSVLSVIDVVLKFESASLVDEGVVDWVTITAVKSDEVSASVPSVLSVIDVVLEFESVSLVVEGVVD
uniref:Uncharacterized protein n=1 Tax=Angiostrongylus cantonensis TaxID=6313 RepID=A0A0K0D891_ANGCA